MENVTAKSAIEAMHKTSEKCSQDMREITKDSGVMDEFIKKANVVKLCEDYSESCFDNCDFLGASDFTRLKKDIEGLPTADVVEVVRCKECLECKFDLPTRENGKSALDGWYCKLNREYVNPEAFCSYGERKEVRSDA